MFRTGQLRALARREKRAGKSGDQRRHSAR
jgi:hypothetical protein